MALQWLEPLLHHRRYVPHIQSQRCRPRKSFSCKVPAGSGPSGLPLPVQDTDDDVLPHQVMRSAQSDQERSLLFTAAGYSVVQVVPVTLSGSSLQLAL